MDKESHISVFVKRMRVAVRIGLHEHERKAPQNLDVSIELFTGVEYLKRVQEAEAILDYAQLYEAVKAWESRPHVELIETYMQELLALGFGFDAVTAVRASISKPDIFNEAEAAGLSVFMRRKDYTKS